jgi:chorismate mutase
MTLSFPFTPYFSGQVATGDINFCFFTTMNKGFKPALSGSSKPLIMAGPCSAESYEQLLSVAESLKDQSVSLFRAGVWKPRSRPNTFEGVGEEGLRWLSDIRDQYGFPVSIEVASPAHVELALKYEIDAFWIGARTTVNPFYVQDIAEALAGVDIPVLVKNPVHADLSLWRGALERFLTAGITRISALHRGFYNADHRVYRNAPLWQIPLDLKRLYPDLQMICDISHICGRTQNLLETAQMAMDLRYDGLMIEIHPDPSSALSDADQQITGEELRELLRQIIVRDADALHPVTLHSLEELRQRIDDIDADIVALLSARMRLATEIGLVKKELDLPIYQPERWSEVLKHIEQLGMPAQLSLSFLQQVYAAVHQESIQKQSEVMQFQTSLANKSGQGVAE